MYCYQCEQRSKSEACTSVGVCGKDETTSSLQDLLLHVSTGISQYAARARAVGVTDPEVDQYVVEALFTTVTNVNFDPERLIGIIKKGGDLKNKIKAAYEKAAGDKAETLAGPAAYSPEGDAEKLAADGVAVGIDKRIAARGDDLAGLEQLVIYGLKGLAAYADHARILGREDDAVYAFIHETLDLLAGDQDLETLLGASLKVGEVNIRVMELLDAANTGTYGHPTPTAVRVTPVAGKAILVSGHELLDLEHLLKQTEGKGINIYTHGEMLPAHGYPELKKYSHLVGNYGGAWQDQRKEFDAFPGAILMTTNCIQKPKEDYKARIFTSGLVAWPGVSHISDRDFTPVIEAALAADGFATDGEEQNITVGFARNAVMSVADKVIEAVKAGDIKHFFLIGGCDGAKSGRNYYTDFAEAVPDDCVILTLACGKYRFNKLDFGDIGGIPRLLDIGQCNDAYSAVQIAIALAGAFETDVNGLPLSMVLSWYEQKAVVILLSLLHLGITDIRLGPTLPSFLTPAAINILVDKFKIKPTGEVADDMKAILGAAV